MEKDSMIQVLQEMESHPAWRLYQDHLDKLCRTREVEKSRALRSNDSFKSMKNQFEIDGIELAKRGLNILITDLTKPQVELP